MEGADNELYAKMPSLGSPPCCHFFVYKPGNPFHLDFIDIFLGALPRLYATPVLLSVQEPREAVELAAAEPEEVLGVRVLVPVHAAYRHKLLHRVFLSHTCAGEDFHLLIF